MSSKILTVIGWQSVLPLLANGQHWHTNYEEKGEQKTARHKQEKSISLEIKNDKMQKIAQETSLVSGKTGENRANDNDFKKTRGKKMKIGVYEDVFPELLSKMY